MNYFPGPDRLPLDSAPGGWVFQVYAVPIDRGPSARLLFERTLTLSAAGYEMLEELANSDAETAVGMLNPDEDAICLVVFDGDNGERVDQAAVTQLINTGGTTHD